MGVDSNALQSIRVTSMHDSAAGWLCREYLRKRNRHGMAKIKLSHAPYSLRHMSHTVSQLRRKRILWSRRKAYGVDKIRETQYGKEFRAAPVAWLGQCWPD